MKKFMMCLCASIMILGLVACGNTKSPNENGAQEEIPEYKELVDPRGKVLESTATGETSPRVVDTIYETQDVVIADIVPTEMGYAVDPTGEMDSTAGIQKALDDCSNAGGGTVYLPAGNYAITDTITIPTFVTLRGDWQDPDVGTEYGTIISVWMEPEDKEIAGAFRLGSSGGAVGLTIYYPEQSLECIRPYPYTFFVEGAGEYQNTMTIRNVTIINGYRGIGTSYTQPHESLYIENVKGTYLYRGLGASNSADVGTVENFVVSNKYWKEAEADCMNAVQGSVIDDYTKRYTTGLWLGDLEWTQFNGVSVDGCAIGIHLVEGNRIAFAGAFYDITVTNCEQGFVADALDTRWGAVIARSYIEGGLVNNTSGKIKLTDVEIQGGIKEATEKSVVVDDEADLSERSIDYDACYTKPNSQMIVADIPEGLFTDASPELQKALDDMAAEGGGVVYVPAGSYRMETPIRVPAGVELRGTAAVTTRDNIVSGEGTVFLCYYGDDETNTQEDEAFITLTGENAGLNGIRIVYPENTPGTEEISSTYAVRGTAKGVYIVDCMISAAAYGVDFTDCDNHYVKGVITCCYYNAFRLGGKGGILTSCLQNGTVMARSKVSGWVNKISDSNMTDMLFNPILRKECQYIIVENATDQIIYGAFAYGVRTGFASLNSENTFISNVGNDNLGTATPQIYVNGGSLLGVNIMRYNGYSYELESGSVDFYNRIAIEEAGEKSVSKTK